MTQIGSNGEAIAPLPPGTVFIVDDDVDVRRAVSLLVSSVGLAMEAFGSAQEFLDKYDPCKPGCLVLDVRMPGISGLEWPCRTILPVVQAEDFCSIACTIGSGKNWIVRQGRLELQKMLTALDVRPPIIFVTAHGEIPMATEAMRVGAVDFIQKPFSSQALLERIREALVLDADNRFKRSQSGDVQKRLMRLTERELEIMRLLGAGESPKHIAAKLSISSKTVDNHRAKILEKLDVENTTQLAHLLALMD